MRLVLALTMVVALTACAGLRDSAVNPANWFGGGREDTETAPVVDPTDPALRDGRPLAGEILFLRVERAAGGAIVTARGEMERQGYWGAELVALNWGVPVNGTLSLLMRVSPPEERTGAGAPRSRQLDAATFLSDADLAGVRVITVRGARNQMQSRR